MPLLHSGSDAALHKNMGVLMGEIGKSPHVQSRAQAIAIGLANQRRYGRAFGGVAGYDSGGAVQDVIQALSAGAATGVAQPAATGVAPAAPAQAPQPTAAAPGTTPAAVPSPAPSTAAASAAPTGVAPAAAAPAPMAAKQLMARGGAPSLAPGGLAGTGGVGPMNMAKSPDLQTPWFQRKAETGLTHGPILSNVPGRTDAHQTHVPSGSYVVNADTVSGLGQGNTLAGAAKLQKMFKMGPYGSPGMGLTHGAGAPRPPKSMGAMASGGGKSGDDDTIGTPTPVNLAGGEVVIPPQNLMAVVHPNLNIAHQIMDAWMADQRKKLIQTLKGLPGPAKD